MSDFVWQTANLAGFISGCYTNDLDMIRASFEDVVIEKQRSQLIPGFRRGAQGRDRRGRAGLLDFRRGPDDVRLGLESDARKSTRCDGRRVRRGEHASGSLGRAHQDHGRARAAGLSRMKFISTRGQAPAVSFSAGAGAGARAGRRPVRAGGVAEHPAPGVRWREHPAGSRRGHASRRSSQAIRLPREIGNIVRDAFNFPAPLVPVADAGKLSVLELFHGPTAAFKDFGARFLAASLARIRQVRRGKPAQHSGGHLRRHRRRGGRCLPSPARRRGVRAVPEGAGFAHAGAAAHLLGRQRAVVPRARHLRRLPAPGEGSLRRCSPEAAASSCRPPTASISGGCCRRPCTTPRPVSRCIARTASRLTSSFRAAISATPWPASGRARSGCRSAASCSRTTPTAPCRISLRAASGSRAPAFRRWPPPWTWARLATWNGCVHCFRTSKACVAQCARKASATMRSARTNCQRFQSSTGKPGARIRPPRPRSMRGCPNPSARRLAGCWSRPRIRQNFAKSWSRSSASESKCRKALLNSSRVPCPAPISSPRSPRSRVRWGKSRIVSKN